MSGRVPECASENRYTRGIYTATAVVKEGESEDFFTRYREEKWRGRVGFFRRLNVKVVWSRVFLVEGFCSKE